MTMRQPRSAGPAAYGRPAETDCTIAIQALCRGPLDTSVMAVTGAAARKGREHIAVRVGRVLIYLEDRAALDSFTRALHQAGDLADATFGPPADAFTETETHARRRFERTGDVSQLG